MKAILVELTPYNPATSSRTTLRICNVNDPRVTLVSGGPGEFLPILAGGPVVSRSAFNGDFTGSGESSASALMVALDEGTIHEWMSYVWGDATVTIRVGTIGDPYSSFTKLWTLEAAAIQRQNGVFAEIAMRSPARLNRPMLYLAFAGTDDGDTGDTGEGRADAKGALKPWLSGTARYVPPVLLDAARQIYCYHGYGPTDGATECFEGGISKGAPDFTWTTYTQMRDAVLTAEQWGHCPSIGMIRLGGQPSFPVTIHAGGDKPSGTLLTKTADIAKRILEGPGGMTAPAIPASNVTAINTSRPQAIDFYLTGQITVEQLLTALATSINGYWMENADGQILLGVIPPGLLTGADPSDVLDLDGGASPTVMAAQEEAAGVPIYRYRLGGRRTHLVHGANDIPASIEQAQDTADLKAFVYAPSSTAPISPAPTDGDLWPDTSTGVTVMRRYNGSAWVLVAEIGTNVALKPIGSLSAVDIIGNSFKRTAAGTDFNYGAVSNMPFSASAYVRQGAVATGRTLVALDNDNTTTALASQKWLFQVLTTGAWTLYEDGTSVATGSAGTVAVDTNIELRYWGTKIEAVIGSTVVATYTTGVTGGQSYFAKWWAYQATTIRQCAAGYVGNLDFGTIGGGTKPEDNADVTSMITGTSPVIIKFESDGITAQSGQLPRTVGYRLFRNGSDVTENATWSRENIEGTITTSMSDTAGSKGQLTISTLSSSTAKVRLTAVHNGLTRTFDITITKDIVPPSTGSGGSGGTNASDSSLTTVTSGSTSGSPTVVSDDLDITLGSSVTQARLICAVEFGSTSTAATVSGSIGIKVQRWNGASWVDVNSYVTTGGDYSKTTDVETGAVSETYGVRQFNITDTGLTAASTQKYRFVAYRVSGNPSADLWLSGTVQAKGDGS